MGWSKFMNAPLCIGSDIIEIVLCHTRYMSVQQRYIIIHIYLYIIPTIPVE